MHTLADWFTWHFYINKDPLDNECVTIGCIYSLLLRFVCHGLRFLCLLSTSCNLYTLHNIYWNYSDTKKKKKGLAVGADGLEIGVWRCVWGNMMPWGRPVPHCFQRPVICVTATCCYISGEVHIRLGHERWCRHIKSSFIQHWLMRDHCKWIKPEWSQKDRKKISATVVFVCVYI